MADSLRRPNGRWSDVDLTAGGEGATMGRVLIVEDDRPFADVLAFAFRLDGHEVSVAVTADEGIRLGLACRPDVIVADWLLRGDLHGGEVCQRILAACPDARTIIITGCSEVVSLVARGCDGVAAVIEKPFHTEEILRAVNQALSGTTVPAAWTYRCFDSASAPV
jgi:DNA-binding NtrC family response regulator